MMYGFCSSNALYSANLSYTMFIFILTPFDTWYSFWLLLFWIKSQLGVAYQSIFYKKACNNPEKKSPSDTYWRVWLVCIKVQAHSPLELTLDCNQDWMPVKNQGYDLYNHLGSYRNIMQFQVSSGGEMR